MLLRWGGQPILSALHHLPGNRFPTVLHFWTLLHLHFFEKVILENF